MSVDGYGTKLYYIDPVTTTETEIQRVRELTPPAIAVDEVETSHLTTPDKTKTFKGGWTDPGSLSGQCEYDASQYALLLSLAGESVGWKVELSDGATVEFNGFVREVGQPIDREGLVLVDFTIRVSGLPSFTPPSGS